MLILEFKMGCQKISLCESVNEINNYCILSTLSYMEKLIFVKCLQLADFFIFSSASLPENR